MIFPCPTPIYMKDNLIPKSSPRLQIEKVALFVWVDAILPSQQFFSRVETLSWVESILSCEDKMSCSKTQHNASYDFVCLI